MNPNRANTLKAQDWILKFLEKTPDASIDHIIKQAHHAGYGLRPHEVTPIRRQFAMTRAILRCLACGEQGHVSANCPRVTKTEDVVIAPVIVPDPVPASASAKLELPPQPALPPLQLDGEVDEEEGEEDEDESETPQADYHTRAPKRESTRQRLLFMENLLLDSPELTPNEVDEKLRERFGGRTLGVRRIVAKCLLVRELHNLPTLPEGTEPAMHQKRRRDIRARRAKLRQRILDTPLFAEAPTPAPEVPAVIPRLDSAAAIRASAPSLSSSLNKSNGASPLGPTPGPSMKDGLRAISAQITALAAQFDLSVLKFDFDPDTKKVKVTCETRAVVEETF